jgi:hypothetical protein
VGDSGPRSHKGQALARSLSRGATLPTRNLRQRSRRALLRLFGQVLRSNSPLGNLPETALQVAVLEQALNDYLTRKPYQRRDMSLENFLDGPFLCLELCGIDSDYALNLICRFGIRKASTTKCRWCCERAACPRYAPAE